MHDYIQRGGGDSYIRITEKARIHWERHAESGRLSSYFMGKHLSGSEKFIRESILSFVSNLGKSVGFRGPVIDSTGNTIRGGTLPVDLSGIREGIDEMEAARIADEAIGKCMFTLCCYVHNFLPLNNREIGSQVSHLMDIDPKFSKFKITIGSMLETLFYVAEVERVIQKHGEEYPGHAQMLIPVKKTVYEGLAKKLSDIRERCRETRSATTFRFTVITELITLLISYPSLISEEDEKDYSEHFEMVGTILSPYPLERDKLKKKVTEVMVYLLSFWLNDVKNVPEKEEKPKQESKKSKSEPSEEEEKEDKKSKRKEEEDDSPEEEYEEEEEDEYEADEEEDEYEEEEDEDDEEGSSTKSPSSDQENENEEEEVSEEDEFDEEDEDEIEMSGLLSEEDKKLEPGEGNKADDLDKVVRLDEDTFLSTSEALVSSLDSCKVIDLSKEFLDRCENTSHSDFVKQSYEEVLESIGNSYASITKLLYILSNRDDLVSRNRTYGRLDTTKLAQAKLGSIAVYKNVAKVVHKKISVALLIDMSRSMHLNERYIEARKAAVMFVEALKKAPNVSMYVYGHTADLEPQEGSDSVLGVYKPSSKTLNMVTYYEKGGVNRLKELSAVLPLANNRDGSAIAEVVKRVRKKTKDTTILFIISDGLPNAHEYDGALSVLHTRRQALLAEKNRVMPVHIHIDSGVREHGYTSSDMFKRAIKTSSKDFYRLLEEEMKLVLGDALKVERR